MHLPRTQIIKEMPIPHKGTKYVARALDHAKSSVPVVIALRDMLSLAKTTKEIKHMINNKLIKINGTDVKDFRESIRLFGILQLDKSYELSILPTGRFVLEETKSNFRLTKVINKTSLKGNKIQLNLHDGTNVILKNKGKVKVGDSLELNFDGGINKVISLEKGKNVFIISGRSVGLKGKIKEFVNDNALIKFEDEDKEVKLDISHIIAR